MTADSSFDKYSINTLPDVPGDIQTLSFTTAWPGFGGSTVVHYQKTGKYYSNIWMDNGLGIQFFCTDDAMSRAEFASIISAALGITVNTWYGGENYGAYAATWAGGPSWVAVTPFNSTRNILLGFISN